MLLASYSDAQRLVVLDAVAISREDRTQAGSWLVGGLLLQVLVFQVLLQASHKLGLPHLQAVQLQRGHHLLQGLQADIAKCLCSASEVLNG